MQTLQSRGCRSGLRPFQTHSRRLAAGPVVVTGSRAQLQVLAAFTPPTVAATKEKFLQGYKKPIPPPYSTVIAELLVQQHFSRFGVNYEYNQIMALGFVSVFEQIMEAIPENERNLIFDAYIRALQENPEVYRRDAAAMMEQAKALGSPDQLVPSASGNDLQKCLDSVSKKAAAGKLSYNKFFAIGLFRMLELTGAKEPAALERLIKAAGVRQDLVNKDLMMYKSILSKLSAAKELMKEVLVREKRKQAEREAAKAAKASEAVKA